MKKLINLSSLLLLILVLIGACKKKEVTRRTILAENAVVPVLTQDKSTVVVDLAKLTDKAITMNWTKTDWGFYEAKSTYYLQVAKEATPWTATTGIITVPLMAANTTSFTNQSLNDALLNLGFTRDVAAKLKSRIKATLDNSPSTAAVYSNELITTVTPLGNTAVSCATVSQTVANVDVDRLNLSGVANKFSWTASNFGYPGLDVVYKIQMAKASTPWTDSSVVSVDLGPSLEKEFTNLEVNDIAIENGLAVDVATDVKTRIVASVNGNAFFMPCYSNEIITKVTPKALIAYLWVPGDYQGWNPGAAGKLTSALGNGEYLGTIEMVKPGGPGTREFKFTSHPNWDNTNYGGTVSGNGGTISTTGGNLSVPVEGTYDFTVSTNSNTWTYALANWGVIGSATAGGWSSDQNMQYNNATGKYTATLALTGGQEIKFRKNDDWGVNLGDDGNNGSAEPNGANIPIATSGTYTITLDVVNKTYTIQ